LKRTSPAIVFQNASRSKSIPALGEIRRWLGSALEGVAGDEVTVRIVDAAEGAVLNRRYRAKRGATNVLAFPAELPSWADGERPVLGDLVLCAPVIEREASEQGKPLAAHWAHVLIHGALHLAGFDHQDAANAAIMETRERELLAAFGYPDPYVT
jgi:probable rRNA maturation factor